MYAQPPNNGYRQQGPPPPMGMGMGMSMGGYGGGPGGQGPSYPPAMGNNPAFSGAGGTGGMSPTSGMGMSMGGQGQGQGFGKGSDRPGMGREGGQGGSSGAAGGLGKSKTIFVANIPFDVTEEQLAAKFAEVGPVADFSLKFDPTTGRPKGFGFCHYHDHETALSAVRNLQEVQVSGRTLRVELSTDEPGPKRARGGPGDRSSGAGSGGGIPPPMVGGIGMNGAGISNGGFSPAGGPPRGRFDDGPAAQQGPPVRMDLLPPGQDLPRGVSATESISKVLAAIPQGKLEEILLSVKEMVHLNPGQARDLLSSHPQLAYALFQALLLMNVVEPTVLQRINPVPNPRAAPPAPIPTPSYANQYQQPNAPSFPPQQQQQSQQYGVPAVPPPQSYPSYNSGPPQQPVPAPSQAGYGGQRPPVPQQQQGYSSGPGTYGAPPPMPPQQRQQQQQQPSAPPQWQPHFNDPLQNPQVSAALDRVPPEQKAMLVQVLQLTQQQVDALAPDQKAGVLQLRAQFGV